MSTANGACRAVLIWGLAAIFYFYDNLLQIAPSAMKPELSKVFIHVAQDFGSLSAYWLYAYGIMQIPAGLLMDKLGPRRLITVACLFCAVGSLVFGVADTLWLAKLGRVLSGIGASFAVVSCLKIATNWFAPNRFAFMTGLMVTVGFLGAVFGLGMLNQAVELWGWRCTMDYGAAFGIVLMILLWMFVRDNGPYTNDTNQNMAPSTSSLLLGLKSIMGSKQIWIASLYAGLMFVPTLAFGGLWGIPFLVEAHHIERSTAGWLISLIYVGWVLGGPFYGWFSDYIQRRNLPMYIATAVTLGICLSLLYLENLSAPVMAVLLFGLGFFSSGFIIAFAVVQESTPAKNSSTAMGFMNAINTFGGALAQPLIGFILDNNAREVKVVNGEQIFSLLDYKYALTTLPISLVISLIILCFLKETYCKPQL